MVTRPTEAADDYAFVHHLIKEGMDIVRINCAVLWPLSWATQVLESIVKYAACVPGLN